jgi:hypothetical protein
MSTELVKSQLDLLKILAHPNNKYRKAILIHADKKLVQAICESIQNVLNGNVVINHNEKEKLKKFRSTLHKLIQKSSLKTKKKILIQRGGFLEYLIPAVITGIASIVSSVIGTQ